MCGSVEVSTHMEIPLIHFIFYATMKNSWISSFFPATTGNQVKKFAVKIQSKFQLFFRCVLFSKIPIVDAKL